MVRSLDVDGFYGLYRLYGFYGVYLYVYICIFVRPWLGMDLISASGGTDM